MKKSKKKNRVFRRKIKQIIHKLEDFAQNQDNFEEFEWYLKLRDSGNRD